MRRRYSAEAWRSAIGASDCCASASAAAMSASASRVPTSRADAASSSSGVAAAPPSPSAARRQVPSLVERELHRRGGEREIAAPDAGLLEAGAGPRRRRPERKARRDQAFLLGQRRRHRALEEIARGDGALAFGRARDHLRRERRRDQADLGGGIGMGEAAADGAAVARLDMADEAQRLGQQRQVAAQRRIGQGIGLARAGPHGERSLACLDAAQLGRRVDVHQQRRPHQPHCHQRHQGLSAGDDLALAARARQQPARLVGACRARVVELRSLHPSCFRAARPRLRLPPETPLERRAPRPQGERSRIASVAYPPPRGCRAIAFGRRGRGGIGRSIRLV